MKKTGLFRTLCTIFSAIAVLVLAQGVALIVGELAVMAGIHAAIGNVIAGVLYIALAYLGVRLVCCKIMKLSAAQCRIAVKRPAWVWVISAVLMPAMVCAAFFLSPGQWQINRFDTGESITLLTGSLFFYSLGAGFVEEMIFRGMIMTALERQLNKTTAILLPSVLFGAVHIMGNNLDTASAVQLVIAGTVVGILFSLVTYQSGSVWSAAVMHAVWNFLIIGVMHIGTVPSQSAIVNYILKSKSFMITGGDFGIEASVVAIAAYSLCIAVALVMMRYPRSRTALPDVDSDSAVDCGN